MFDKTPEPKKEEWPTLSEPKKEEPKAEVKAAPKKAKASKPEEKKEEKPEPPRRNRVTVLRDLVEDLESDSSFSDEQRRAFQELNRRLTRALAR